MSGRLTPDEACCRRCESVDEMHRAAQELAATCGVGAALQSLFADIVAEGLPHRFQNLIASLRGDDGPLH